jgi:DNA-binding beta-propeller fold protein YncE
MMWLKDHPNRDPSASITPPTAGVGPADRRSGVMASRRDTLLRLTATTAAAVLIVGCGSSGSGGAPTGGGATTGAQTQPTQAIAATTAPSASPLPALKLIWQAAGDQRPSSPAGGRKALYWPSIDPRTGNIWASLSFDGVIWIFGTDGSFKGTFGAPGKGNGEFNFARRASPGDGAGAMAFAPDGTLFVADDGNNRIQKFDPQHRFVKAWGSFGAGDGQFADADAIATDGKSVYVSDDSRGDIQVFDTDGTFERSFRGSGTWLAMDNEGNLFSSGFGGMTEYDPSGKLVQSWEMQKFAGDRIGLAVGPNGRLYFNIQLRDYTAPAVVEFDPATATYRSFSPGGETLAVDPSGDAIYLANFVNPTWPEVSLRKYALPAP